MRRVTVPCSRVRGARDIRAPRRDHVQSEGLRRADNVGLGAAISIELHIRRLHHRIDIRTGDTGQLRQYSLERLPGLTGAPQVVDDHRGRGSLHRASRDSSCFDRRGRP